jgi:hypothetical protein
MIANDSSAYDAMRQAEFAAERVSTARLAGFRRAAMLIPGVAYPSDPWIHGWRRSRASHTGQYGTAPVR